MSAATNLPSTVLLPLSDIRTDGGTQSRAQLNADTIEDYAEKYSDGLKMPPVVVFYDGEAYWLADGFHRRAAAEYAGKDSILSEIRQGTRRDAILHSVGANEEHGLRRTSEDKRRAVGLLLRDPEWGKWPQKLIASTCRVSEATVSRVKVSISGEMDRPPKVTVKRGGTEYELDVTNHGRPPKCPGCGLSKHIGCACASATESAEPEGSTQPVASAAAPTTARQAPAPNPAMWWTCPVCSSDFNRESAGAQGWVKRGFCGHCEEEPTATTEEIPWGCPSCGRTFGADENPLACPDCGYSGRPDAEEPEATTAPAATPPDLPSGTVRISDLERLIAQRCADPEYASVRDVQKAVTKRLPSRSQRMIDFVLDGGELALLRLGLDWTVTPETAKRAYRAASLKAHPDRGGSPEEFMALTKGYEMIKTMLGEVV